MEYVITVVVTLLTTLTVTALKPEWMIGWLLKFLENKIPKNSNAISNALGYTLMNVGSYALASQKDTKSIEEANKKIKEQLVIIEKELKKYWKTVSSLKIRLVKNGIQIYYYSQEKRLGVNKWWEREKVKFYKKDKDLENRIKEDIKKWNEQMVNKELKRIGLK